MLGLLIGTVHLLVILNATVRSVAGKWVLGGVAGASRVVLLMALSMAGARIRMGGADPTASITFALYGGPLLTVVVAALSFHRRRKAPAASEAEALAILIMRAWLVAAAFDMLFVAVNVVRLVGAPR